MRPGARSQPVAACRRALALGVAAIALLAGAVVAPAASPAGATFPGANGKIIYLQILDLMVMEPDGSGATKIGGAYDQAPSWSPDGSKIAFDAPAGGISAIFTMDADGTGRTQLTSSALPDVNPSWSPDGTQIAFESARTGVLGIYVMNADGSDPHRISPTDHHSMDPSWSPDGTRIAFVRTQAGSETVALMDPDGSNVVDITPAASTWGKVDWSPDSSRLALSFLVDGRNQVHTMNPDGSDVRRLTSDTNDTGPFWSPDGTRIAFTALVPGTGHDPQVVTSAPDGSDRVAVTPPTYDIRALAWQPLPPTGELPPSTTTSTTVATTTSTTAAAGSGARAPVTPRYTG
jgi:Tol biopolymer transport system component